MKTIDPKEPIDWRMSASQALSKAEGEMTKVAIGGLVAAAAALEGTHSVEGEKALRSVVDSLDGCAAIASDIASQVVYCPTTGFALKYPTCPTCCRCCGPTVDATPPADPRDDDVDVLKFDARSRR